VKLKGDLKGTLKREFERKITWGNLHWKMRGNFSKTAKKKTTEPYL